VLRPPFCLLRIWHASDTPAKIFLVGVLVEADIILEFVMLATANSDYIDSQNGEQNFTEKYNTIRSYFRKFFSFS